MAGAVTGLLAMAPASVLACPVCALVGTGNNTWAYQVMSLMLTVLPLGMIGFALNLVTGMLFFIGIGLVLPQAMAAAMAPFPERAGAASSLAGFLQMVSASGAGVLVVVFLNSNATPLVIASAISGVLAFGVFMMTRNLRAAQKH